MPQIQHPWYRYGDDQLWKQKRLLFANAPTESEKKIEPAEKKQEKSLGQERIEKYLGKSKEEAEGSVDKIFGESKNSINDVINQWNKLPRLGEVLSTVGSTVSKGWIDGKNKAALNTALEDMAKEEAKKRANEIFEKNDIAAAHAANALNIRSYKIEASKTLINNLDEEISSIQDRLKIIDKANAGLNVFRRMGGKISSAINRFMDDADLRNRLAQIKSMRAATMEIKTESEAKTNVQEKKTDKIREWDGNLRALVAPYLVNENHTNAFEGKLKGFILNGTPDSAEGVLLGLNISSSTEKRAIENLLLYLKEGSVSTRIGEWRGGVSAEDVRNYYRLQVQKIAEVNQENSTMKDKINALASSKPGQEVKIGNEAFILLRRDAPEGYLLKRKYAVDIGYINARNPDKPIFSLEDANTIKERELTAVGGKSLDSIDFGSGQTLGEVKKEETPDKSKVKPTFRQRVDTLIRKVAAAFNALKTA